MHSEQEKKGVGHQAHPLAGLLIINGQSEKENYSATDIYDKSLTPGKINSQADIFTLTENSVNNAGSHSKLLKTVLGKYIFLMRDYSESIAPPSQICPPYINRLLASAFDPHVQTALNGSVELVRRMGVPAEEMLDRYDKITSFFLD